MVQLATVLSAVMRNLVSSAVFKHFIESVQSFCMVAWYGNLNMVNKNTLGQLVKVASKVLGVLCAAAL